MGTCQAKGAAAPGQRFLSRKTDRVGNRWAGTSTDTSWDAASSFGRARQSSRVEAGRTAVLSGRNLHLRSTRRQRGGLAATASASAGGAHRDSSAVGTGGEMMDSSRPPHHPSHGFGRASSQTAMVVGLDTARPGSSGLRSERTSPRASFGSEGFGSVWTGGRASRVWTDTPRTWNLRGPWRGGFGLLDRRREGPAAGPGRFGGPREQRVRVTRNTAVASAAAVREGTQVWKTTASASADAVGRETQAARTARTTIGSGLRHADGGGERNDSGSARPGLWACRGREEVSVRGRHGRTGRAASAGRRGAHGRHARAWQRSSAWVDDGTHQSGLRPGTGGSPRECLSEAAQHPVAPATGGGGAAETSVGRSRSRRREATSSPTRTGPARTGSGSAQDVPRSGPEHARRAQPETW